MKHRIPHNLEHGLARKVARQALQTYQAQFSQFKPGGDWQDDDTARLWFSPPGGRIEGWIRVTGQDIEIEIDKVPFLFRAFRGKAIDVIEVEVKEWIEKARRGQLD
mgnify:CR=1 FL=1